ncbi:MAG: chromate resistance protein ChrB domain-containing protein [Anaerolineae bacterium]
MEQKWIAFSYTLSAKKKSSVRVTLWRRLQRLGAITPVSGIYLLPAIESCIESFQWLAQEVESAEGQSVLMRVDGFEGLDHQAIIEQFQAARQSDYAEIDQQVAAIEERFKSEENPSEKMLGQAQDELTKLKRRYAEIVRTDYFESYEGTTTEAKLNKLGILLFPETTPIPNIPSVQTADYQGKTWVTRPQPHVDRLSSIWLIRRFIDQDATIRYSTDVAAGEIGFDMNHPNAEFGHNGPLCTFETMIKAFQIEAKGIETVAEIVHQIDLTDERFVHPEAIGIDAILRGWLLENLEDQELEKRGLALFDGIYQTLANRS